MQITRRVFTSSMVAAALIALPSVAFSFREPFVSVGDDVSFLNFEDWSRPRQPSIVSAFVEHIGEWDGQSYPIILSHLRGRGSEYWDAIDAEWCIFRREVPDFHWRDVSAARYPNIHSFVREKRFGEDPMSFRARMLHNQLYCVPHRETVPVRKTKFA